MRIPSPNDLNALEIAVWAAEYVRAREAAPQKIRFDSQAYVRYAIEHANGAIEELRSMKYRGK